MSPKLEKALLVLVVMLAGSAAFLAATGRISIVWPFSRAAKPPVVTITKAPTSRTGNWGSRSFQSLALFDVKTQAADSSPFLERLNFSVQLNLPASQTDNGLRSFMLTYYYCRPNHGYGYGFVYGYQGQECQTFYAYPSSVTGSADHSTIRYEVSWPLFADATIARLNLLASMAFTGTIGSPLPQKIQATLNSASVGYFTLTSLDTRPASGNWLQITPGYGYPLKLGVVGGHISPSTRP